MAEETINVGQPVFRVATITSGISSIGAGADQQYVTGSTFSYPGYTPVAIVGYDIQNGNYGSCNEFCDVQGVKMAAETDGSGIKYGMYIHNYKTSTISIKKQFKVLYVKV